MNRADLPIYSSLSCNLPLLMRRPPQIQKYQLPYKHYNSSQFSVKHTVAHLPHLPYQTAITAPSFPIQPADPTHYNHWNHENTVPSLSTSGSLESPIQKKFVINNHRGGLPFPVKMCSTSTTEPENIAPSDRGLHIQPAMSLLSECRPICSSVVLACYSPSSIGRPGNGNDSGLHCYVGPSLRETRIPEFTVERLLAVNDRRLVEECAV